MPVVRPDGLILSYSDLWPEFTGGHIYTSLPDLMDEPTQALWPVWIETLRQLDGASLPVDSILPAPYQACSGHSDSCI